MKIIGHLAELEKRERRLFGVDERVMVAAIPCERVLGELALRQERLSAAVPWKKRLALPLLASRFHLAGIVRLQSWWLERFWRTRQNCIFYLPLRQT
jgi:hypothetical protein